MTEINSTPLKHCSKCDKDKPATLEYFPANRGKLHHWCKTCCIDASRTYRANKGATPRIKREPIEGHKFCTHCEKWHLATSEYFPKRKNKLGHWCKECSRKATEESRRRRGAQSRTPSNRQNKRQNLPYTLTVSQWCFALEYFNDCCAVCGRKADKSAKLRIVMDHWIPVASPDCPGTIAANIVPLCHGIGGCNSIKNRRDAHEWLISQYGEDKAEEIIQRIELYFQKVITIS